jgi:hypothetical protein
MNPMNQEPLDPERAMAQLHAQLKRDQRKQAARASGIKLITRGGLLAFVSAGASGVSAPSLFTPYIVLASIGGLIAVFGALKVYASTQI